MKKTALSIGMIVLGVSFTSQADTLLGLYAGAQGWNMQTSGGFSSDGTNANFNFEDKANSNLYVAFEHPLPLIPNIKVQRTIMNTMGETTLNSQYSFGDEIYAANTDLNTDVQLTATDFILYYELFDNDLISNIKFFDQSNNEITGFNAFPSSGNTKATFNFSVITNGAVIATDVLRVTINVELSNIE